MIFIYRLKTNKISLEKDSIIESFSLDGVNVKLDIIDDNKLQEISFSLVGISPIYNEDRTIITDIPCIKEKVFRICSYLVNRVLIETSLDMVDPKTILLSAPEVCAETEEEKELFKSVPRRRAQSLLLSCLITKEWKVRNCQTNFEKSAAYATFADAVRIKDEFLQFQQLYKVFEHHFSKCGAKLDKSASNFLIKYDTCYSEDVIREIRELRVRLTHPNTKKGHINPEDYGAYISEVRSKYKQLYKACLILIEHAPIRH